MTIKCSHLGCVNGVLRDCFGNPLKECYDHFMAGSPIGVPPPKQGAQGRPLNAEEPIVIRESNTLTKREEFAKAAMQGLCANPAEQLIRSSYEEMAKIALDQADALLAELAKGAPGAGNT